MNEELKDILEGAGIKAQENPTWDPPTHITELIDAAKRSIKAISEGEENLSIIVLVGNRVEGGMHRMLVSGGSIENTLDLFMKSGDCILEEAMKMTTNCPR